MEGRPSANIVDVAKTKDAPQVIEMIETMAQKSKRAGKIVRIGGLMSMANDHIDYISDLLEKTKVDKLNTSTVVFNV